MRQRDFLWLAISAVSLQAYAAEADRRPDIGAMPSQPLAAPGQSTLMLDRATSLQRPQGKDKRVRYTIPAPKRM